MNRFAILSLFLIISLFILSESKANVIVDDADSNAVIDNIFFFTSEVVPTGSGKVGDYELIACGVSPLSQNLETFSSPTPGTWTELDQGPCGFEECIHGIWGRFTQNEASEQITCSWSDPSFVFAAGSFRYNEVDSDDPIIEVACSTGVSEGNNPILTAPSVMTEAGSQVARIYTYTNSDTNFGASHSNFNDDLTGTFTSDAVISSDNVHMHGDTEFFQNSGPTGEATLVADDAVVLWRACTIALRMGPPTRAIPTMSEWGLMAAAGILGIAGALSIRRKSLAN